MDKCLGCDKPGAPSDAVCAGCAWRVPGWPTNGGGGSGSGSGSLGNEYGYIITAEYSRWENDKPVMTSAIIVEKGEQDEQLRAL